MDKKAVLKTTLGRKPSFRMITALLLIGVLIPSIYSISLASTVVCSLGYVGIPRAESTDVSGIISEDTTWTLAGSPYIVVGDVVVETDVTLTIEAGVVVRFATAKNLVIDGSLIAQGNATHRITFTSNATIQAPGDWGSIRIRANDPLQTPTSFDYLSVEFGGTGISFESGYTNRSITHSAFHSNVVGLYIYAYDVGSPPPPGSRIWRVDDCEISNNTNCGISVGNAVLNVQRCLFSGNGKGVDGNWGTLRMDTCKITNQQGPGVWSSGPHYITIKNSNISNNNGCGIQGLMGQINLERTIISRNIGDGINSNTFSVASVALSECNVTENEGNGIVDVSGASISDSIVSRNALKGVSSWGIGITRSTLVENGGVGIYTYSGSIHYSSLYNNQQYDIQNSGASNINATYNWWGTLNETRIRERVYDYYDDYNLGKIFFNPFLTSPPDGDAIPPTIGSVSRIPNVPNYDEGVVVSASITDNEEVDLALLSYKSELSWHNVSMNRFDNTFDAAIPVQPYGTLGQYKIYANDTSNNWATSGPYSYTVGDFVPPEVKLSRIPDYPLPGQKVKVYANVTEPTNASGVKSPVYFSYRVNSGSWLNTTMTFNIGLDLYETTIQDYEKHDIVEYLVKALDNAGNTNTTIIQHYEVLRCDVNHNGVVDAPDLYMIGQAWNTRTGEPGFIAGADINEDGIIDATDLTILNTQYGKDP